MRNARLGRDERGSYAPKPPPMLSRQRARATCDRCHDSHAQSALMRTCGRRSFPLLDETPSPLAPPVSLVPKSRDECARQSLDARA